MVDYSEIKDMVIGFLKTIGPLSPGLKEKTARALAT